MARHRGGRERIRPSPRTCVSLCARASAARAAGVSRGNRGCGKGAGRRHGAAAGWREKRDTRKAGEEEARPASVSRRPVRPSVGARGSGQRTRGHGCVGQGSKFVGGAAAAFADFGVFCSSFETRERRGGPGLAGMCARRTRGERRSGVFREVGCAVVSAGLVSNISALVCVRSLFVQRRGTAEKKKTSARRRRRFASFGLSHAAGRHVAASLRPRPGAGPQTLRLRAAPRPRLRPCLPRTRCHRRRRRPSHPPQAPPPA